MVSDNSRFFSDNARCLHQKPTLFFGWIAEGKTLKKKGCFFFCFSKKNENKRKNAEVKYE